MGRQYRRANSGELDWVDASHASKILREMRVAIEGSVLENRIAALETALAEHQAKKPLKANGHGLRPETRP